MSPFLKFISDWREHNMTLVQEKDYIVTIRTRAISPQAAADKAADFLNAGGEPDSIAEPETRKRFSVWFKDNAEGNEDNLTALATDTEAQNIENHLQGLKESGTVSEFVVVLDSPDSADEVIAYIDEKLEG